MGTTLLEGSAKGSFSGASHIEVLAKLLPVPGLQEGFPQSFSLHFAMAGGDCVGGRVFIYPEYPQVTQE